MSKVVYTKKVCRTFTENQTYLILVVRGIR